MAARGKIYPEVQQRWPDNVVLNLISLPGPPVQWRLVPVVKLRWAAQAGGFSDLETHCCMEYGAQL